MEGPAALEEEHLSPPPRLFERLRQIAGYTWDESKQPVHSSYGNWHVFGSKNTGKTIKSGPNTQIPYAESGRGSPRFNMHSQAGSTKAISNDGASEASESDDGEWDRTHVEVVAKISSHALREERAYHICKSLSRSVDPHGDHIVRPVDLLRLSSQQGDKGPIVVAIFESAGNNTLVRYMDFGPAWYRSGKIKDDEQTDDDFSLIEPIPLPTFLDFAIGATECLEILHHGQRIVHGEIRGDAFHFNEETGQVKLINFGSGLRSFEHGLTSSGWSALSKEPGAKTKLSYISPEQTGRMPAEPDSRTDIYSLGILFWTLLTQQPAFDGSTPMDIIQGVLGRRLPSVSSVRLDVPDVIGNIISKMTAKSINERYHSASGLRYDLIEMQRLLGDGDSTALKNWKIATKDVSSFFILPNVMIGRSQEHDEIVKIIDKVSKRHLVAQKQGVYNLSSGSSLLDGADASSHSGSSSRDERRDYVAVIGHDSSDLRPNTSSSSFIITTSTTSSQHNSHDSQDSIHSFTQLRPWERNNALASYDTKSSIDGSGIEGEGARSSSDGVGSVTSQKNLPKFRRQGCCEVISIAGAAGLGKSCLVQSVQVEARRRGYFASSKFDQARSTAFGPVLKLLSSLFKQVFSESDTDTPFHRVLKQYVRPAWPMLSKVLGLPDFLLGSSTSYLRNQLSPGLDRSMLSVYSKNQSSKQVGKSLSAGYNKSIRADYPRRDSSPTSSRGSLYSMSLGAQSSHDFLLSGSSTKSMRLINTFLDVLRTFAQHKFICFCLDDLQFADPESLELISQIISSRIKIVIMVTYRPDEMLPERIKDILEPPDSEGYVKANGVGITRIELRPLTEDDITQYVAATLCRPAEDIIPLAAVIQAKTAGSPFYMREMLDACHRKNCIWYDYKKSVWQYDLDRIFQQFAAEKYDDVLNTDFVTRRLKELPASSRSILAWASLLGSSFSFELVQRLLSGEFNYGDSENGAPTNECGSYSLSHPEQDAVGGLQVAIQAYIVVATENDDRFRFAHDRYVQAAASLRPDGPKMHFIIAQTLLKYYSADEKSQESIASHICESVDIIKKRILHRQSYRKLLFDCAQSTAESGARTTAAKFYAHCFALLQDDPWDDTQPDVYYDETLALYTRAAECYHYMSRYDDAMGLLSTVFSGAKTAVDKAPAWILQSRLYAQRGDSTAAFQALKSCLLALGVEVDSNPTFEKCDAEFERLSLKIQSTDRNELITKKLPKDSNLASVGAVLVEIVSAAYWSDPLTFYQMSLVFVSTHITCGGFPQSGLSFIHLATIAIARFNMISFANDMGNVALDLIDRWRDPYTLGRGNTLYSLFVGHIQSSLSASIGQLEGALEYTIQAGDRVATILNFGVVALLKFFASEHLAELELFCQYGPEEVPNWQYDCRGGTMLIAVRQASRALQGKTLHGQSPLWDIMSDEAHNTARYLSWIKTSTVNSERPIWIYESIQVAPLFLYGHYDKAVQIGRKCVKNIDSMWSARNTRFLLLIHGLSLAGLVWNRAQDPRLSDADGLAGQIEETVKELRALRKKIADWQVVNPVNFYAGSAMLDAQIAELLGDHGSTLHHYEDCLDHANANSFVFEEALGNYLLAGFFLRRGARRSAKAALRETIMLYRQFGAVGVAKYIEEEHSLLLMGPTKNLRTAEVGVQTDFAGDSAPVQYHTIEEDGRHQTQVSITETKGDRIDAWQGRSARPDAGGGLPALDMLDLTSILESSQVISSVLQVDQLLTTMCEIILQNCGGVATLAAIIVEEDDPSPGWSVAASGDSENGATAHIPGLPLSETPEIDESVILYCTRFRETVFLPDLVRDERFSNVTESWWARHPQGKSVIAIPIAHGVKPLLGVLYLQGHPNAFTDRNLTVLQLLVNQIGISYSNALTLKAIEKVSASNISMVQSQKRALAKAKEAEAKAKLAEAEALRNVKLAEEAAKAKSIFLANVSHELRTPLNGVIGNSELLRVSGNLSKEQAEMSDSIRVSADLLLTVINDILDFSKMEADRMELFNVAFNPDEMLREVVRSMSYSSQDKKMKDVEIRRDFQLPQTLIYGDPVRLHQVLGNLIGNSLKFTERGSITVGARVDEENTDHIKLTFWVKDTGIGIPASQIEKLFKPFSQADASTARKYGGSGLGLSICKSLIESMMHGKIELESHESFGTTVRFSVVFPKADPEASAGDTQTGSEQRDPMAKYIENSGNVSQTPYIDFSNIPREQLRICIAEDNPINQKIAIQFVQKLGFVHVDAYDNGLATVEGLRRKARDGTPYHLVLMDCQMPIMDGYESTKLLRRDENEAVRGVLVIAMTASAIQGDREKCLESGMNDYLAKPVRVHVLKKKLEEYLHQPPVLLPNLQAEANQVANDVMSTANGAVTPQSDSPTPPTISSSMKSRPSPPIRTSSKTKPSDITNATSKLTRSGRSSSRSQGSNFASKIDTNASISTGIDGEQISPGGPSKYIDSTSQADVSNNSIPTERRRRSDVSVPEITRLQSKKDEDRSSSEVRVAKEQTIPVVKPRERKAQA